MTADQRRWVVVMWHVDDPIDTSIYGPFDVHADAIASRDAWAALDAQHGWIYDVRRLETTDAWEADDGKP